MDEMVLYEKTDDVSASGLVALFSKQCCHWLARTPILVTSLVTYRH